ncbi:MAG: hypothetical protein Q8934_05315 [Bacillota bacterium]|nr:hypothetical protein [Bacillota bacterium]
MSECKLDHTLEDVKNKFQAQEEFIPNELEPLFLSFFEKDPVQEQLNEVFHLLKKYDLATVEEKEKRNDQLREVLRGL